MRLAPVALNAVPAPPIPTQSVVAVVVTHNRRALLEQCLQRIAAQSRRPDAMLVVDNASDDGTAELLAGRDDVDVVRLEQNGGGAGGFHAGLEAAVARGHAWAWLMDDDTFPEPDALEALLGVSLPDAQSNGSGQPVVLASRVEWTDGRPHPMNQPWPKLDLDRSEIVAAARAGVMPLRAASFVSLLIHRDAVDRHGLPFAEYFIYNDDLEYTARILRREIGYWVPASLAIHHTAGTPRTPASAGGDRFYYDVRNRIYMVRGSSWSVREKALLLHHLVANVRTYLRASRFSRAALSTVARALSDGLAGPRRRGGRGLPGG